MEKIPNRFRWAMTALVLLLSCSILIFSCQDEDVKSSKTHKQDENVSEISLIEKEIGISLHKMDLTISDAKGENEVTIRLACLDKSMLDEYLKYRSFSIEPIYSTEKKERITLNIPQDEQPMVVSKENYESTIIIEVVNQELKAGVNGIGFYNKSNSEYKFDTSGRTKYANLTTHTSNNWPSILSFQAYSYCKIQLDVKPRWYSRWFPIYGPATWCCYDWADFDVDGPYRSRLWVEYDYSSDYYYQWFY